MHYKNVDRLSGSRRCRACVILLASTLAAWLEPSFRPKPRGGCGARRLVLSAYALYLGCRAQRRCRYPIQPANRRDRRQLRRHHREYGLRLHAGWRSEVRSLGRIGRSRVSLHRRGRHYAGMLFSGVETDADSFIGTLGLTYRLIDRTDRWLDLVAGSRFWSVDNDITFKAGRLPEVKTGVSESLGRSGRRSAREHRSRLGYRRSRLCRSPQRRIGPNLTYLRRGRLPVQRSCPGADWLSIPQRRL